MRLMFPRLPQIHFRYISEVKKNSHINTRGYYSNYMILCTFTKIPLLIYNKIHLHLKKVP